MWVLFIMNILLLQGLTTSEYMCDQEPTLYCHNEHLSFELPNDVNDLNVMCRAFVKYVDCLQLYDTMCPDQYIIVFFKSGDSSFTYKLIKEICQNDSKIHMALVDHVSCIKATVEAHVGNCTSTSESKSEDYFAFLIKELKSGELDITTIVNDFFVLPPCLELSYRTSCLLHEIENSCGTSASEVSREIFQRSSVLFEYCSYEDFPKIRKGFVHFLNPYKESDILQQILNSPEFINVATYLQDWD